MRKKVGLYGGTFDPIHNGHLNLAFELMEKCHLDEVWWIPTSRSPLRPLETHTSVEQRFKMVELAIEEIPQFKALDVEIKRQPPAYTIDTVKEIVKRDPDKDFFLLLGKDALDQFMAWKEPLELVKHIAFLVGGRREKEFPRFPEKIHNAVRRGIVETSIFDISATHIRERVKKKLYSGHLLPAKVLDFIYVNQLYFTV